MSARFQKNIHYLKERTEGLLPNLSERLKGSALCCGKTLPAAGFTEVVKGGWHCWYPEKGAMNRRLFRRTMTFTDGIQSAWDQLGGGGRLPWCFLQLCLCLPAKSLQYLCGKRKSIVSGSTHPNLFCSRLRKILHPDTRRDKVPLTSVSLE